MAEKDCGCTVNAEWTDSGKPPGGMVAGFRAAISYCPKHDAVDDLLTALVELAGPEAWTMPETARQIAQNAIRKAQTPPGAKG